MSTSQHFDCHYCKDSLLGKKYIMKEDTQYCTKCYENLFANCCQGCNSPIGCDSKVRTRHRHHTSGASQLLTCENNKKTSHVCVYLKSDCMFLSLCIHQ